ncbi:MAG: SDR family oxidoreductase [Planctomycetota bacterium]|jgi:uncharacterized protein YbjT (DUF2867 family)
MNGKIFITGATGTVGGEVLNRMMLRGEDIRAGFRSVEDGQALSALGIEAVPFDYTDSASYEWALDGVDRIFLVSPPGDPAAPEKVIPFIDDARKRGVRLIVNISAMGAEFDESSPLYRIENHIRSSGIDSVILRPTWFMQNFRGFLLDGIVNQGGIFVPAGEGRTSFVDVRDVAEVAIKSLIEPGYEGRIYTLTGSRGLDYYDAAAFISEASECEVKYVPLTEEQARLGLGQLGWSEASVDYMLMLFSYVRDGFTSSVSPDVKAVLGRDPISFENFAFDYANTFKRREAPAEC